MRSHRAGAPADHGAVRAGDVFPNPGAWPSAQPAAIVAVPRFPGRQPRDARRLEVGRVRPHERLNLTPVAVGDLVCVHYEEDGKHGVGIAQVRTVGADDSDQLEIQWYSTYSNVTKMNGKYAAGWIDARQKFYWQEKPQHHDHKPYTGTVSVKYNLIHHGFNLTQGQRIPLDVKRRACRVPEAPFKLPGHGVECDCVRAATSGSESDDSDSES
jgi:hypothetical protein